MGYNGPAPGIHVENGIPVLTAIVDAKRKIPQPGDPYPDDPRWLANKATRVEQIRPNAWSVDIPYVWALDWVAPRPSWWRRMVRRMFRR